MDFLTLKDIQSEELKILEKSIEYFEKKDINYYLSSGSFLGAVRHKGFIPWDDDMDVGIPREDYEKFINLCNTEKVDFELHTFKNDSNHIRYFARIEDPTITIVRNDRMTEEISSAWIDVFPLDGMPNNKIIRIIHKKYILYRRALYKLSCFSKSANINKKNRPLVEKILIKIGLIFPVEKIFNTKKQLLKLDKALKRFSYNKSNYLVNAMGAYKFNEMFHKKYYGEGKYYKFEDTEVFGPSDYDTVCTQLYGDYMTPPIESERNHHGSKISEGE